MSSSKKVIIPYTPRDAFRSYHAATQRYCLTVAHRRAGKTVARINKLIRKALECKLPDPKYAYIAPTRDQAKDTAWLYLKRYSAPLLPFGGKAPNESDLIVTLPNNATIRLYSGDAAERMRGNYYDGVSADESQDLPPYILTQIVLPALSDRLGWLDISGTSKGWGNLLGQLYQKHKDDPNWFVQLLPASQTGIMDVAELESLKRLMPANEYAQEYECSFDAAITGAYYAAELTAAEPRITNVPHDPMMLVNTAWDLGISDSMSIWFYQAHAREIRVIDYYEAAGYGLDHYVAHLKSKQYNYGRHIAPHDIQVRELGTGKSRLEVAQALGLKFDVCPNMRVEEGINAARMTIPRIWFDKTNCAQGINALRQYRAKMDDKRQINLGPLHDWTSHAADAFRYLCVGHQDVSTGWGATPVLRTGIR